MSTNLVLILVYRPRTGKVRPLAIVHNPQVIIEAARVALAELDSAGSDQPDPLLALDEQLEAEKARQLLLALLPELRAVQTPADQVN